MAFRHGSRGEQLGDLQADQARQDYETRSRQLQADDADRDAQGDEGLKQALRSVEHARRREDERELAAVAGAADLGTIGGTRATSSSSPPAQEPGSRAVELVEPAHASQDAAAVPSAGFGPPPSAAMGAVPPGSARVEASPSRGRHLEDLIRQREAELEALWQDFDKEAQEVSEGEENTNFNRRQGLAWLANAVSESPRVPVTSQPLTARTRERAGGPLAGAWGGTSEDDSSGAEAFRRLGSQPPGAARVARPAHSSPGRRGVAGNQRQDWAAAKKIFEDGAWTSGSEAD